MKPTIRVRYLPSTRPELDAWVASLPGVEPERRAFAQLYLEAIRQMLVSHNEEGKEPQELNPPARALQGWRPTVYEWPFAHGWFFRFVHIDKRALFGIGPLRSRDVIIIKVQEEPLAGEPSV
jgi:hypothetical protein